MAKKTDACSSKSKMPMGGKMMGKGMPMAVGKPAPSAKKKK